MKPSGPGANTTRSSRRTGWSPAPWNGRWRQSWPRSGKPNKTCSPPEPAARSSSPRKNWHGCPAPEPTSGRCSHAPSTTFRERKQLLRAIVSEVVVTVDSAARTAALRIIWQGGGCTELEMALTKTGGHFRATDEDTVELVRRLAAHYDDTTIALILSRQHRRTGTGLPFTKSRVQSLRVSRGIPAHRPPESVSSRRR